MIQIEDRPVRPFRTRPDFVIGGAYIPPRSPQYTGCTSHHTRQSIGRTLTRWFIGAVLVVLLAVGGVARCALTPTLPAPAVAR